MGFSIHGYNAYFNLPQHKKQMKQVNKILARVTGRIIFIALYSIALLGFIYLYTKACAFIWRGVF